MPPTLEEAKKVLADVEAAISKARSVDPTGLQTMLDSHAPPANVKALSQSKPFSLHNFVRAIMRNQPKWATHEFDTLGRYAKAMNAHNCGLHGHADIGIWLPTHFDDYNGQMTASTAAENDFNYVKAVFAESRPAYDPDEAAWLEQRYMKTSNAQSAFIGNIGGTIVPPPVQGEVIPLIRPQAAALAAGATAITLPPNGKFVAPRITSPPVVAALTESQDTQESTLGTDQLVLQSRKIGGMCRISEEATMYTSGTLDNIVQMELGRSLGLKLDAFAFYGLGTDIMPAGLTSSTYNSATNPNAATGNIINMETLGCLGVGPDGNQLFPQYGDLLPALVAERSFNVDAGTGAWVLRPMTFALALAARASAVTAGDQQGPLVDILRRFSEGSATSWRGRKVVQTTNIKNNYTKGAGTSLSDGFFGIWQYMLFASYGAIQFQTGHDGVSFQRGQYLLRATMFGDIGLQYPPAFLWYPNLFGVGALEF